MVNDDKLAEIIEITQREGSRNMAQMIYARNALLDHLGPARPVTRSRRLLLRVRTWFADIVFEVACLIAGGNRWSDY